MLDEVAGIGRVEREIRTFSGDAEHQVGHGLQEREVPLRAGTHLHQQLVPFECDPRCVRDPVEQFRLRAQCRVVDDGSDRLVGIVEPRDDAIARIGRKLEAVAIDVDVVLSFLVPVRDLRRLVAQRLSETLLHLARAGPFGYPAEDGAQAGATRHRRAEEPCEEEERNCRERHDQRDAHDCAAEVGERRHDEPDRKQDDAQAAGEVDKPKDPSQCRRATAPAADQKHKSCHEQSHGGRGPQSRLCPVRSVVVRHENEVVRAGVRLARLGLREHGVQKRCDESSRVPCGHERPCLPADQLTAGICQQKVNEHGDEQASEERSERVRNGVVRLAQAADEHAEADRDHERPGAVRGTPRPADQAGEDERPADEQSERRRDCGMLLVVTGQDERDGDRSCNERRRPEVEPGPPCERHAIRRAAIAAPDRSAFGTKPVAPQPWMQRP